MAGTNNFLVFNEANNPTSTMSDADYFADLYRLNGLIPMIADPNAHNKMFRQWSIMVTALANIIASMNYNASDDNLSTLQTNLKSAIEDVAEAKVDSRISILENWKDDITATTTEINYLSGTESNIQQQINAITGVMSSPFPTWNASTPYAVGDICIASNFKSYQYLECVVAGTTGATMPSYADVGQLVTDNEVKWLVCDFRDSAPVGTIKQDIIKRDGWLKLNGATINVADYPRLVNFLTANSLIQSYTSIVGSTKFKYGDSNNTTLLLPDFEGLFIENSASNTLDKISAGLPNITGVLNAIRSLDVDPNTNTSNNLAITWASDKIHGYHMDSSVNSASKTSSYGIKIDASKSNSIYGNSSTVQPPAVTLIPVIKY